MALVADGSSPWQCWLVASIANTLGSCVNWWIGRYARRHEHKRWYPASPKRLQQAEKLFSRWGIPSLFFAWVPIVGDALTVTAGLLRVGLLPFTVIVFAGKALRYALVIFIIGQVSPSL